MKRLLSTLFMLLWALPALAGLTVPASKLPSPYLRKNFMCAGDSTDARICGDGVGSASGGKWDVGWDSALGVSLMKYPRRIDNILNYAVSGSSSTDLVTYQLPNMLASTVVPDVILIGAPPGNDLTATVWYANYRTALNSLTAAFPNAVIIVFDSIPQATRSSADYFQSKAKLESLARSYPNDQVRMMDMGLISIKDTSTAHDPRSGYQESDTVASHATPIAARVWEPTWTKLLDELGFKRDDLWGLSPGTITSGNTVGDRFHATQLPYGNLFGGYVGATSLAANTGNNVTGNTMADTVLTNYIANQSTDNSELKGTITSTTIDYQGNTFTGLSTRLFNSDRDTTNTVSLTANRSWTMATNNNASGTLAGTSATKYRMRAQLLVRITGNSGATAGLVKMSFSVTCKRDGATKTYLIGTPANSGLALNTTTPTANDIADGTYPLVIPGDVRCDGGGSSNDITFSVQGGFRSGTKPDVSVAYALLGFVPQPIPAQ